MMGSQLFSLVLALMKQSLLSRQVIMKKTLLFVFFIILSNLTFAGVDNMTHEYWHVKWKTKDIGWDQQHPNPILLSYFNQFKLKQGAKVFVPLSGKSIDMAWLAEKGYNVISVELNLEACQLFFSEHNIPYTSSKKGNFTVLKSDRITLFVGDFFDLDKAILGPIEAIYDRAALIALPKETQIKYVAHIKNLIEPHTQLLLITFKYDENEMSGPPFSVDENEIKIYFRDKFKIDELYNQPVKAIPEHLRAKGLTHLQELAFHLVQEK